MDLQLEGKRALVCAASRGLGRAAAAALAAEGARVVVCARGREALARTAAELGVSSIAADVSVEAERVRLAGEAQALLGGGVDILVNNAGGPPAGPLDAHGTQAWRDAWELNFVSGAHLASLLLPGMKARRWGRIVNLVSYAALEAIPGLVLSNAVRPAVVAWTRAAARELAPHGVGVVAVCPGLFLTDRLREIVAARAAREGRPAEEILAQWVAEVPAGRMGDPAELGALVAFLASPRAGYLTGSAVAIDGGIMRRLS